MSQLIQQKNDYSLKDITDMAVNVCASGLFPGINTKEAAISLMLLCQAENIHPMKAVQRYHIIKGRPTMKADSMLGEFQSKGGKVKWVKWDDSSCEAIFFSPGIVDGVTVEWSIERAHKANLTSNPTWKSYPRNMLRARVISDGVRMCMPAIIAGIYTPEEMEDIKSNHRLYRIAVEAGDKKTPPPLRDIEEYDEYYDEEENHIAHIKFTKDIIDRCKSLDELKEISYEIHKLPEEVKTKLRSIYAEKFNQLKEKQNELQTNE